MIDNIKKICEEKGDHDFKRKIGGCFENLPAHNAKYHLKCLLKYTYNYDARPTNSIHEDAFNKLVKKIDPKLEEGRALTIVDLLTSYKSILVNKKCETAESYTVQKLKNRCTQ